MNDQITLKSGAHLELKIASFDEVSELLEAVTQELKQVDISSLSLSDLGGGDINSIKNLVLSAVGSKSIRAAMFKCAGRSLHNGQKITKATFEPAETRGDYLPTAWEVIKFNLAPFMPEIDLSSLTKGKPTPLSHQ